MANAMSEFKATANAHMRRDMAAGGKWRCACEACHGIRSLLGMDKALDVWPVLRELQDLEEKLHGLADSPERQVLLQQYYKLYDKLADVVAQ